MEEYNTEQSTTEKLSALQQSSDPTAPPQNPAPGSPLGSPVSTPTLPVGKDKLMKSEPVTLMAAKESVLLTHDLSDSEVTTKKVCTV